MADPKDKKDPKKDAKKEDTGGATLGEFTADLLVWIFILFVISALLGRIAIFFGASSFADLSPLRTFSVWFRENAYPVIRLLAFVFSIIFIYGIYATVKRLTVLNREQNAVFRPAAIISSAPAAKNTKWEEVLKHAGGATMNDWKIAIITADIMLDELLTAMSYRGQSVGDKLKAVEPADFNTLNAAWEAHKMRNAIAHDTGALHLNQHEVRRIVSLYESVFKEFGVI